jgi:hypothetical protein
VSAVTFATSGYNACLYAWTQGLNAHAHLYVNDPELNAGRVRGDFVEPVFAGYGSRAVERWTPPALRGGVSFSVCDPLIWEWVIGDEPLPIRGVFVTNGVSGELLWAWRRPGDAYPLGEANPLLIVYVRLTFPLVCP